MSDTSAVAPAASTAPVSETSSESEVSDELTAEETAELAAEEVKVQEPPKSTKRKFSPKVNGRQLDIDLDPNNDEEINKYLSKALAADQKFEEAAQLRKNVENLINELRSNPRAVLTHPDLGIDIKKFATDILNEEIEDMQKTPEQKELEKLRKELEGKNKREQELEEEKRTAEMARLQEQAFKQFDDEITEALSKSTLPKSPYVVKRVADLLIEASNLGFTDARVQDIMPIVEQQISAEIQKMFETMPEEMMEQLIGKQNLSRMRKSRLAKMKKSPETSNQIKETGAKKGGDKKEEAKPIKFKDFFGSF